MQQPKNTHRLLRALAKQGLDVSYEDQIYTVRSTDCADAPAAEVLLPPDFPIEAKAFKQLASLTTLAHPGGGNVTRTFATPDFHPGDTGVAIGSVIQTQGMVVPAAVGSDINCGMRLHVVDLSVADFLAQRNKFVALMKGDYLLGTRDVTMTAAASRGIFNEGIPGWLEQMSQHPMGSVAKSDLGQLWQEIDRVQFLGSLAGNTRWAPIELTPAAGLVRDGDLGTIGGGNHFVEIQEVMEIRNPRLAYQSNVKVGQLAIAIHSGSRTVGKYIGGMWRDRAKAAWLKGYPFPQSSLFALSTATNPDLVAEYLEAEATAANYAFVNRLILAELIRLRLREVYGDLAAPLVCDLPHNLTFPDGDGWIVRKGACAAGAGQLLITPGSMGTPSYLLSGLGNDRYLNSAAHGAGRAISRFELTRAGANYTESDLGLTSGVDCITLRPERRIEEAPAAYKSIDRVIDTQVAAGMVEVVAKMRPILTFKA
ncbi:RtcB family protein [Chamaesiphon sp. VAR_48_metabat_403]|uniref:RtcB family protein n=1 Tax=Chamaesiphon sp. VAR_48_metabat_403 TaxID=2964700 RepID=UPI00286E17D4|nr:RtcB family protein [Chamaesiphon sp. VAR_48_metabat_403]